MHTKEELAKMGDIELVTLASGYGLAIKDDRMETIYDIIEHEAELNTQEEADAKPKRTRIARATKTSKIFTADQDGKLKSMETKKQRKRALKEVEKNNSPFGEMPMLPFDEADEANTAEVDAPAPTEDVTESVPETTTKTTRRTTKTAKAKEETTANESEPETKPATKKTTRKTKAEKDAEAALAAQQAENLN